MLRETLTSAVITTRLSGSDKHSVIESLMDLICRSGKVKDRALAFRDVLSHEEGMSTGMEHGIAIPHAKTDAVDELVACVGISKRKIDFENLDRKPARIFIMTLSPKDGTGPHVQFLSEIGKLLKDANLRKRVLKARTDDDLLSILTE